MRNKDGWRIPASSQSENRGGEEEEVTLGQLTLYRGAAHGGNIT